MVYENATLNVQCATTHHSKNSAHCVHIVPLPSTAIQLLAYSKFEITELTLITTYSLLQQYIQPLKHKMDLIEVIKEIRKEVMHYFFKHLPPVRQHCGLGTTTNEHISIAIFSWISNVFSTNTLTETLNGLTRHLAAEICQNRPVDMAYLHDVCILKQQSTTAHHTARCMTLH